MSLVDGSELELDLGLNAPCGVTTKLRKIDGRWQAVDVPIGSDVCFCCGFVYCIQVCRAGLGERSIAEVVRDHEQKKGGWS